MATAGDDEFTARMFEAINGMMLDMIAAIARKDYEDRRRRQSQGIAKAKNEGRYRGRPENTDRNKALTKMLKQGLSWNAIIGATGASRSTLSRLRKRQLGL
jgi:DNA invertase Pin-like site-specific DNA recombinase